MNDEMNPAGTPAMEPETPETPETETPATEEPAM